MDTTILERDPVTATNGEHSTLAELEHLFRSGQLEALEVVGPHGTRIRLPDSVFRLLRRVVRMLARGQAVSIVSLSKELTTREAADLCNVSRPYLIRLLEEGKIPYTKTGTHRRIKFEDLMAYKNRRDAERAEALAGLARLSQELDLEDVDGVDCLRS